MRFIQRTLIFEGCKWGTLGNAEPNTFANWRTGEAARKSARTLNQYLETVRAFLN